MGVGLYGEIVSQHFLPASMWAFSFSDGKELSGWFWGLFKRKLFRIWL